MRSAWVERELVTRYENKALWLDVGLGGGALALAASGIITLVDAGNVAPAHTTGPDYNPVGGGTAAAVGAGLLAGGAVLGTIAGIDAFRMWGVTHRTEVLHVNGPASATKLDCGEQAKVEGALVELRLGRISYGAGITDASGRISTTLDAVFEHTLGRRF